jgi:hypothetical protein
VDGTGFGGFQMAFPQLKGCSTAIKDCSSLMKGCDIPSEPLEWFLNSAQEPHQQFRV